MTGTEFLAKIVQANLMRPSTKAWAALPVCGRYHK